MKTKTIVSAVVAKKEKILSTTKTDQCSIDISQKARVYMYPNTSLVYLDVRTTPECKEDTAKIFEPLFSSVDVSSFKHDDIIELKINDESYKFKVETDSFDKKSNLMRDIILHSQP